MDVEDLEILNTSKTPPFYIEDGINTDENLRLKYRYLDLRRPEMQQSLLIRHRTLIAARKYLDRRGFWEIETPMLTRSTPKELVIIWCRAGPPGKFFCFAPVSTVVHSCSWSPV